MFHLPLSQQGRPYPDPIHPIIVHFVIAMVLFAFICIVGFFSRRIEHALITALALSLCLVALVAFVR